MMAEYNDNIGFLSQLSERSRGENGYALLHEVVVQLKRLLESDEPSHIDLRAIPLSEEDYALLDDILGEGGVSAEVQEFGISRIQATGIPGVWWVTHLDDEGQVLNEFLEINYCPEILIIPTEDIREGRSALQARLFEAELGRRNRKG